MGKLAEILAATYPNLGSPPRSMSARAAAVPCLVQSWFQLLVLPEQTPLVMILPVRYGRPS